MSEQYTEEEALSAFFDFVRNDLRMVGIACIVGFSIDGDNISCAAGGQTIQGNPTFDRLAMRTLYNLERQRHSEYESRNEDVSTKQHSEAKNGPLNS